MYHPTSLPAVGLYLEGVTVSVGYGDFLETTLLKTSTTSTTSSWSLPTTTP